MIIHHHFKTIFLLIKMQNQLMLLDIKYINSSVGLFKIVYQLFLVN